MTTLTVFTPTFNRKYCLHNCYESLKRQTCKDFIWLIVDDGSNDNTKELVDNWIMENQIPIRYVWQENQGMHGAHNTAYQLIDTELNVCIDSDDYMPDDAVEKIIAAWKNHGNNKLCGIIGLDSYADGAVIGTCMPKNIKTSTLYDLYYKYGAKGDKKLVYRTEYTKKYPYPLFEGERFVGLAYKYYMLDCHYEMLIVDEVLCRVEYMADGSTRNILKQYRANPKGYAFYRKELMKLPFVSVLFRFRNAVHYVSSSLICRNFAFMSDTPCKILTFLAIPLGIIVYMHIMYSTKRLAAR